MNKDSLTTLYNRHADDLRKLFGDKADAIYKPLSLLGCTLIPEVIVKGNIEISSAIGSGVYTFTFLSAGQVFGLKGLIIHSILFGFGTVAGGFAMFAKTQ